MYYEYTYHNVTKHMQFSIAFGCNLIALCWLFIGGEDYQKFPDNCSEVIFPIGRLSAPFDVMIRDDNIFENSEVFRVTIVNISVPNGVGILGNPTSAEVTILDDDGKYS